MSGMAGVAGLLGRSPAVAGSFYPAEPTRLDAMVTRLLAAADRLTDPSDGDPRSLVPLLGLLVPHAGLEYSGVVAAAGWRQLREPGDAASPPPGAITVVILGTNHRAGWLHGVGAWDGGAWITPTGELDVDGDLSAAIVDLGPPFLVDRAAHLGEHSIEVQLPLLHAVAPGARIVPLAVSAGTGPAGIEAGDRLGALLAARRRRGERIVLAISSDMAHYPAHGDGARATARLLPVITDLDPERLAAREGALVGAGIPGLVCGMCGIEPTVLGLAALRAAGASRGTPLAAATSADAGGPAARTVGYLAVGFGTTDR